MLVVYTISTSHQQHRAHLCSSLLSATRLTLQLCNFYPCALAPLGPTQRSVHIHTHTTFFWRATGWFILKHPSSHRPPPRSSLCPLLWLVGSSLLSFLGRTVVTRTFLRLPRAFRTTATTTRTTTTATTSSTTSHLFQLSIHPSIHHQHLVSDRS